MSGESRVEWPTKRPGETARHARARLRKEVAVVREDYLLDLFASGLTHVEIAERVRERFGLGSVDYVKQTIPRALGRRAEARGGAEVALQRYLDQLEKLLHAYMPRALGTVPDDDGQTGTPDLRAAEIVLKIVDRMAVASGGAKPREVANHTTNVNLVVGGNADAARQQILASLDQERTKMTVIDGQLALANTSMAELTGGPDRGDTLPPPVGVLPPGVKPQEEQ